MKGSKAREAKSTVNPLFKEWLRLAAIVKAAAPDELRCPRCGSGKIGHQFVGDAERRIGFLLLWCSDCLEGIHISRIDIPEKAAVIPFSAPAERLSHIPHFKRVSPLGQ
ncbi:hypothetical protein [Paenibacillus ginsengihumi]|jgi:hypothetical protein|uniref:hypothetical protein n=1 Tax=Paenibacillus ginsengihumi TaxID=431596 RepID=UPI0003A446C2|nr:hypothetical protein [Paenibacillus ginsengihumi]